MRKETTEFTNYANGIRCAFVDNDSTQTMEVKILFEIPTNLNPKYRGMPHLFEHMIFTDLIDDCTSNTEVFEYAKKCNVSINAYTEVSKVVLEGSTTSLILPRGSKGYRSCKRYDMSEEGTKFLVKFIKGAISKHLFRRDALESEKNIVISEKMASEDDKLSKGVDIMHHSFCGQIILGTHKDIEKASIDLLHEFESRIPSPIIVVSYNSNIESMANARDKIDRLLDRHIDTRPSSTRELEVKRNLLPNISTNIYDGVTVVKDLRDKNSANNTLGILRPSFSATNIEELEKDILSVVSISMITDSFREGSLMNLLREKLNISYGSYGIGLCSGDSIGGVFGTIIDINESVNMNDDNMLRDFLNKLDVHMLSMDIPTETEYVSELSERIALCVNDNIHGASLNRYLNLMGRGFDERAVDALYELDYNFSYELFRDIFDEVKNSLVLAVM